MLPERLRVGYGEDAHRLASGRRLVIGGVYIESSPRGAQAHSDGDVLLHATSDALLSSVALGDIGSFFPPSDPQYHNADSGLLLQRLLEHIHSQVGALKLINLAAVVTLDSPKLGSYRRRIEQQLATLLASLDADATRIAVSFKTSEGLAPDHVQARVSLLLALP